jgi:mRNA-degrading endonuclease RelE of RelBE toxin-antitoxin system
MKYQIKFRSSALKEILSLPKKIADRVSESIDALAGIRVRLDTFS